MSTLEQQPPKRPRAETVGEMGAHIKEIEAAWALQVPPNLGLVVRLDGKRFSAWTRRFKSPFDARITNAFRWTTTQLMWAYRPDVGYTQSDEINLVWYPNENDSRSEHPFSGKINKLNSVLASQCTATFNAYFPERDGHSMCPDEQPALFDARSFGASREMCDLALQWRTADALRNGINSVASSVYSHEQLEGVSTNARVWMLDSAGVDVANYEAANMRGVRMWFESVEEPMTVEQWARIPVQYWPKEPLATVRRTRLVSDDGDQLGSAEADS